MLWVGIVNQGTYTSVTDVTYIIMYTEDNIITAGASHGYGEANNTTSLPKG